MLNAHGLDKTMATKKDSKKKAAKKHAGGRPPIFKTVKELDAKIEEYFSTGYRKHRIGGTDDDPIETAAITLTDLCLFLGFADKCSFYDYEKKPEFSHSIKRARMTIEREYEERLAGRSAAGAIFALKNFGWRDKQEIDHTTKGDKITQPRIIIGAKPEGEE